MEPAALCISLVLMAPSRRNEMSVKNRAGFQSWRSLSHSEFSVRRVATGPWTFRFARSLMVFASARLFVTPNTLGAFTPAGYCQFASAWLSEAKHSGGFVEPRELLCVT